MDNLEQKLNSAISQLKNGVNLNLLSKNSPEFSAELKIAQSLFALPKNLAPLGAMQRKYALAVEKNALLSKILGFSRFAIVSVLGFALFSTVVFTAHSSFTSLPGEKLFAVKKIAQEVRLKFAFSEIDRANLQVAFAQKRLEEAQNILNSPNSSQNSQIAALTELKNQTEVTTQTVKDLVGEKALDEKTHPLVNSLEKLTKKQKDLANQVKNESNVKVAANTVLESSDKSSQKIKEIKNAVAIAGVLGNQITIAKLVADQNTVSVLGEVTKITKDSVSVANNTFYFLETTHTTDSEGFTIHFDRLQEKDRLNILGKKNEATGKLEAIEIFLIKPQNPSASKTQSTTTLPSLPPSAKSEVKPSEKTNPNVATGSFLIENSTGQ